MPNIDLLKRTLAHIEAHPEEWLQETWRCETGMCFAGHAVILGGATWVYPEINDPEVYESELTMHNGVVAEVRDRAVQMLDLKRGEAAELFAANNTLDDLRRVVGELCGEGEVTP